MHLHSKEKLFAKKSDDYAREYVEVEDDSKQLRLEKRRYVYGNVSDVVKESCPKKECECYADTISQKKRLACKQGVKTTMLFSEAGILVLLLYLSLSHDDDGMMIANKFETRDEMKRVLRNENLIEKIQVVEPG